MNNYISNYTDIVTNVCKMDENNPGTWILQVMMLEDLRNEIADLRPECEKFNDSYGIALIDIILKKIVRRIDFLNKKREQLTYNE